MSRAIPPGGLRIDFSRTGGDALGVDDAEHLSDCRSYPRTMHWNRRRDLEGGKELGIWLLVADDGSVERELYVESHEYRGGGFDVYTATPEDEWTHHGEFETSGDAFERALEVIEESSHPVEPALE